MTEDQQVKKRVGRPKKAAPPPESTALPESQAADDQTPAVVVAPWFGKKHKFQGRPDVVFDEASGEIDILSVAVHSNIKTDEALTEFILNPDDYFLGGIGKVELKGENGLEAVTRYYTEMPEHIDKRICYKPCPEGRSARWAIRGQLFPPLCYLLDGRMVVKKTTLTEPETQLKVTEVLASGGPLHVWFELKLREAYSITPEEMDDAELRVMSTGSIGLARQLISIRKLLQRNCERGIEVVCGKMRAAEDQVIVEKSLRETQVTTLRAEKEKDLENFKSEVASRESSKKLLGALFNLQEQESAERLQELNAHYEGLLSITIIMSRSQPREGGRHQIKADEQPQGELSLITLEDAKLEIERLKECLKNKTVLKPKPHRKTKDPDLYLATEAEIKKVVRSHILGRSVTTTSTTSSRRRSAIASIGSHQAEEDIELEAARKLKALSRSREQDLCNAESGSEQLGDVVESLSALLTNVTLTIEDIATRRTGILNHMRSLAMHSRSITGIIRERPYLLTLARRMNHERAPVVRLDPLRSLVNVTSSILKQLRDIENITLESVGGTFEVMSLEEAAEEAWQQHAVVAPTPTAVLSSRVIEDLPPSRKPLMLTHATLRRHTEVYGTGDGAVSD